MSVRPLKSKLKKIEKDIKEHKSFNQIDIITHFGEVGSETVLAETLLVKNRSGRVKRLGLREIPAPVPTASSELAHNAYSDPSSEQMPTASSEQTHDSSHYTRPAHLNYNPRALNDPAMERARSYTRNPRKPSVKRQFNPCQL